MSDFPTKDGYEPPSNGNLTNLTREQLIELLKKSQTGLELSASDPTIAIDNRDLVRMLLTARRVSPDRFVRLVEPYDNGFYKRCDGKSTPLSFMRVPRSQRILGFHKDVVSVRHDFDYYIGTGRKKADLDYLQSQIAIGQRNWIAWVEYVFLRIFGLFAWLNHGRLRRTIVSYGSEEHIQHLPFQKGKYSSGYVWLAVATLIAFVVSVMWLNEWAVSQRASPAAAVWPLIASIILVVIGLAYLYQEIRRSSVKPHTVAGIVLSLIPILWIVITGFA